MLAATSARAPVAIRLAVRDLARYRARSGGAVAAVSLAVAISAAISISAGASQAASNAAVGGGNLPDNEIALWLGQEGPGGPIPVLSTEVVQRCTELQSPTSQRPWGRSPPSRSKQRQRLRRAAARRLGTSATRESLRMTRSSLGSLMRSPRVDARGRRSTGTSRFTCSWRRARCSRTTESLESADADFYTSHDSLDGYYLIPIRQRSSRSQRAAGRPADIYLEPNDPDQPPRR